MGQSVRRGRSPTRRVDRWRELGANWCMASPAQIWKRVYEWCRPRSLADALQIIGAVVTTAGFVAAIDFGPWRPILPLLAVAFFAYLLWAISLVRQSLYPVDTSPALDVRTPQPNDPTQPPGPSDPVAFVLRGRWLNTPFRCETMGVNELGEPTFGEDLYLTVIANDFLENVSFSVAVKDVRGSHDARVYRHEGQFQGTVTPGIEETVRIFRRTFRFAKGAIRLGDGSANQDARLRRDVSAVFFEGTSFELSTPVNDLRRVEARVNHKKGSVVARFVLDHRTIPAPRSRVVLGGGPITADIPHHYADPIGILGDEGLL